jgi:hypothetical protein
LSNNQQAEVIKVLVAAGVLSPPHDPTGRSEGSQCRVVYADEIERLQKTGLENALAAARKKIG